MIKIISVSVLFWILKSIRALSVKVDAPANDVDIIINGLVNLIPAISPANTLIIIWTFSSRFKFSHNMNAAKAHNRNTPTKYKLLFDQLINLVSMLLLN